MTKETINRTLEEIITRHGFTFTYRQDNWLPAVPQTSDDYASIVFFEEWDFDAKTMTATSLITCHARVCRMGAAPGYDELMKAADQIQRSAQLMQEVNSLKLEYVQHIGK